ncbi:hypothetical protein AAZX31_02G280900 [Glycine max]
MKGVVETIEGFSLADLYPSIGLLQVLTGIKTRVEKIQRGMDTILENIVRDHRNKTLDTQAIGEENGEYLVDVLLRLPCLTVCCQSNHFVKNPRVMEKVQIEVRRVFNGKGYVDETSIHELKYLRSVIKETLRLHPPSPLMLSRECSKRCEINGYEIQIKSKVIVNAWAIGRDPKYWIEAEKFSPERFIDCSIDYEGGEFQFIPYGAGRRICPGINFGIVNVEFSLANLLFHFDWKMAQGNGPEELDMTESFGL